MNSGQHNIAPFFSFSRVSFSHFFIIPSRYTNAVFVNGVRQAVDVFTTVLEPNTVRLSNFNMRIGGPVVAFDKNKPYLLTNVSLLTPTDFKTFEIKIKCSVYSLTFFGPKLSPLGIEGFPSAPHPSTSAVRKKLNLSIGFDSVRLRRN
jgi:hypothetical protein